MKRIKLKKYISYYIEWNDTYSFQGWHDEEGIDERTVENSLQQTTAFFIKEDKHWLVFCMHLNHHEGFEEYGIVCWIPKGAVVKIKQLYENKR